MDDSTEAEMRYLARQLSEVTSPGISRRYSINCAQLIEVDLARLEKQMEVAGAPWTPGRIPEWKDQ